MKVNFVGKCIEVTNAEMKRAENYGSREYEMLMRVIKELPDFQITVKQQQRRAAYNPYARLTYDMMARFIEASAPEMMEDFCYLRSGGYHYSHVKQWFLANFPDVNNIAMFAA